MESFAAWLRNMICFLCFFQVFLHLAPREQYRKYLKFFGDLLLVFLVIRPMVTVLGKGEELDQILRMQNLKGEYSELEMHMEGVEELRTGLVEKTFRWEIERQIREIPAAYGFSVLSMKVSFDEENRPEGISMKLLSEEAEDEAGQMEKIREELHDIYGMSRDRMEISTRGKAY